MKLETRDIAIEHLGLPQHDSPLISLLPSEAGMFSRDTTRVIGDVVRQEESSPEVEIFERAGQRQRIFLIPLKRASGLSPAGGCVRG